jgi:hypothetical protein
MSALDLSSEVAPGTDEQQPTAQGPSLTLASMGKRHSAWECAALLQLVLSGHVAAAGETAAWVADPVTGVDPGGAPPRR